MAIVVAAWCDTMLAMSQRSRARGEDDRRRFVADPDVLAALDLKLEQLSDPDVRSFVIRHEHLEFAQALKDGRREIDGGDGPTNPRVHLMMHEIVATQLWDDSPPEAWDTGCGCAKQATSDIRSCRCLVVSSAIRSGKRCTTSARMIASVASPRCRRCPARASAGARPGQRPDAISRPVSRLVRRRERQGSAVDVRANAHTPAPL